MKGRKIFSYLLLILFLVVSFLFISPKVIGLRSQFRSSQLKKTTVKDETTERTDYMDANGRITIAADLGYATIITQNTGNSKRENYYDDQGEPISRYAGYYGIIREYDDKGNNVRTIYLNRDGIPSRIGESYAIEEREYNDQGQNISVRYYDAEGLPTCALSYGYGRINEYDKNGKISRITYIDEQGHPMMTGQGYAIVSRNYYQTDGIENGKVESEFYFDENGEPVSLSLGQYGVHKEYDMTEQE